MADPTVKGKAKLDASDYKKGANQVKSSTNDMKDAFVSAQIKMQMINAGFNLVKGALGAVGSTLATTASKAIDFELGMQRIQNVAGITADTKIKVDIDNDGIFETVNAVDYLGDSIQSQALQSIFSIAEMQAGFYELAAVGSFTADEITTIMDATTNMAMASGASMDDAGAVMAQVLNAFQMDASNAANVADVLTTAANSSALEIADLGTALGYVGPIAQGMGVSIEETSAALSVLSNVGFEASQAGVYLRSALNNMAKPTEEAKVKLRQLGIEFFDAQGNMKSMTTIMNDLALSTADMTKEQKVATMNTLFGTRAGSAMMAMMENQINSADKYEASLEGLTAAYMDVEGAAESQADLIMATTAGQIALLEGSVENAQMIIGDALAPAIGKVAGALAEILSSPAVLSFLESIGETLAILADVLVDALLPVLNALLPALEPIAEMFAWLVEAISPLITLISEGLVDIMPLLIDTMVELFEIAKPIIEVLVELGKIAIPIIMDAVKKLLPPIMRIVKVLAKAFMPLLKSLGPILDSVSPLIDMLALAFENIASIMEILSPIMELQNFLLGTQLRISFELLGAAIEFVMPLLQFFGDILSWVAGLFGGGDGVIDETDGTTQSMKDLGGAIGWLSDMFDAFIRGLGIIFGWLLEIREAIQNLTIGIAVGLIDAFMGIVDAIAGPVMSAFDDFMDGIGGITDGVGDAIGNVTDFVGSLLPHGDICMEEALKKADGELQTLKDNVLKFGIDLEAQIPIIGNFTDQLAGFGELSGNESIAAETTPMGGNVITNNITITIEGNVLDDELITHMTDELEGFVGYA